MYFKDSEVQAMQSIFMRLDTSTLNSLQYYSKNNEFRTGCTLAIYNKWNKPVFIFQNFELLSPYRMKLLHKLAGKIPFSVYITYPREDLVRVGWKVG